MKKSDVMLQQCRQARILVCNGISNEGERKAAEAVAEFFSARMRESGCNRELYESLYAWRKAVEDIMVQYDEAAMNL